MRKDTKIVSFNICLGFKSQLTEKEIFEITGIESSYFKPKGTKNRVGLMADHAVWRKMSNPVSDDLNVELENALRIYQRFLPNKLFYDLDLEVIFDPTESYFFPKILNGKSVSLLSKCGLSLGFDNTMRHY